VLSWELSAGQPIDDRIDKSTKKNKRPKQALNRTLQGRAADFCHCVFQRIRNKKELIMGIILDGKVLARRIEDELVDRVKEN